MIREFPGLEVLRPIWLLEDHHVKLIDRLCEELWDGTTPQQFWEDFYVGKLQAWDFEGRGLVLTEINILPRGKELFIVGVVGHGMMRRAQSICDDLKRIMSLEGCTLLRGHSLHRGLDRLYDKMGATRLSVCYMMEAPDGR